ncbi:ABC transporter ATP-binding protein [Escherichia coli SHECO002]|nr:ABC transporter ATP-binding protein [Escherichia coli SHECO002]
MLVSSNVTMQFGSKPLFENISVKFGGGNRYGLIGANGSGKSTFMKILGGDLEPTLGNVSLDPNERIGKLRQDQFAFEEFTVLDTVIMGHKELWEVKQERDRIYALPEIFFLKTAIKWPIWKLNTAKWTVTLRKLVPVNCCLAWEFQWNSTTAR